MGSTFDLLRRDGFLKALLESMPTGVLVVDQDRRVHAVNRVLERTFGVRSAEIVRQRPGEALHCVHADEVPEGCGYAPDCEQCALRNTALAALEGDHVRRRRVEVELVAAGKAERRSLIVSASPITYEGERFAIVMVEDVTEYRQRPVLREGQTGFAGIIGRHPAMAEVYATIQELAPSNAPVLIEGESGTGKELVAAAIHKLGPRAAKLFVPVNCSALPESLLESELFGHVRGAFTGAVRDKKGRFELADGGTIFLDEIGDIAPAIQVKLLRVLQERSFERVGGEQTLRVDVRIISATHRALRQEVAAGRFRADLFYRLCVVPIRLPPLRERREDIALLADHVLAEAVAEAGRDAVALSPEALNALIAYDWPGNVRELQNAIQFALVKCRGNLLELQHLPPQVRGASAVPPSPPKRRRRRKLRAEAVRRALRETDGNKAQAARALGVSRATLYRFLDEVGLPGEPQIP